jgi:hypothetical protein
VISLISTGARRLELRNNSDELDYTQRCGERVLTAMVNTARGTSEPKTRQQLHNTFQCLPELLVDAKEVDLRHGHVLVVHAHVHRNGGDHPHQGTGFGAAHTHVPLLEIARRGEGPLQEGDRIVEPVHIDSKRTKLMTCTPVRVLNIEICGSPLYTELLCGAYGTHFTLNAASQDRQDYTY